MRVYRTGQNELAPAVDDLGVRACFQVRAHHGDLPAFHGHIRAVGAAGSNYFPAFKQ
jgi:hypothetical protein